MYKKVLTRMKERDTIANGTERNGTERNGTERNGTERNGTERPYYTLLLTEDFILCPFVML